MNYTLNDKEKALVLLALLKHMEKSHAELSNTFGSIGADMIAELYDRLYYSDYCAEYGKAYDEMTPEDFFRANVAIYDKECPEEPPEDVWPE